MSSRWSREMAVLRESSRSMRCGGGARSAGSYVTERGRVSARRKKETRGKRNGAVEGADVVVEELLDGLFLEAHALDVVHLDLEARARLQVLLAVLVEARVADGRGDRAPLPRVEGEHGIDEAERARGRAGDARGQRLPLVRRELGEEPANEEDAPRPPYLGLMIPVDRADFETFEYVWISTFFFVVLAPRRTTARSRSARTSRRRRPASRSASG